MNNDMALASWYKDNGDSSFCLCYPLTDDSVVFDVGGYQGNWSDKIAQKYNPFIFIFEPVKKHCDTIRRRFRNNTKVQVFNFGLSDRDEQVDISLKGDGSCTWNLDGGVGVESVFMRDVAQIITMTIDLISINIEGGEYNLLSRMIKTNVIQKCRNAQVQFHDYPNCENLRRSIREELNKTHIEIYSYPFVWESWRSRWI